MKPEEVDAALLAVSKLFFTGAGAQQLLEKAQNYLGNPILIHTPNLDVLASSKTGDIQDETWHRIVNEGPERYQLYKEMSDRGISHKLTKSLKPGLVDDSSLEHRWIIGQLRSANSFVGGVNVLEYRREFEAGDFLFIQGLCEIFSYYVVNSSGLMAFEHPSSEFLLAALFRGKDFNPMVVSETLSYLDWTLNLVHQVLVARSDSQFKLTNPYPIKIFWSRWIQGLRVLFLMTASPSLFRWQMISSRTRIVWYCREFKQFSKSTIFLPGSAAHFRILARCISNIYRL